MRHVNGEMRIRLAQVASQMSMTASILGKKAPHSESERTRTLYAIFPLKSGF